MKKAEQPTVELRPGVTLGGWELIKELGSGAFGRVFEATHRFAPEGSWILKVAPLLEPPKLLKNGQKPKRPKKPVRSMEGICLNVERELYELQLRKSPYFARLPPPLSFSNDKAEGFRYLPLERLDCHLWDLAERYGGTLPLPVAARAATHLIEGLSRLHAANRLYHDCKPYNFMIRPRDASPADHADVCVIIDMGTCTEMLTMEGALQPCTGEDGTAKYLSLAKHEGRDLCPRMDYEALALVLVELMGGRGTLPWSAARSRDELVKIKKETSVSALCAGLPAAAGAFLEATRALPLGPVVDVSALLAVWAPHVGGSFYDYEGGAGNARSSDGTGAAAGGGGGGGWGVPAGSVGKGKGVGKAKVKARIVTLDTSDEEEEEEEEAARSRRVAGRRRAAAKKTRGAGRGSRRSRTKATTRASAGASSDAEDEDVGASRRVGSKRGAIAGRRRGRVEAGESAAEDESPPKKRRTGRGSRAGGASSASGRMQVEGDAGSGDDDAAGGAPEVAGARSARKLRRRGGGRLGSGAALREVKGGARAAVGTPGRRSKLRRRVAPASLLGSPGLAGGAAAAGGGRVRGSAVVVTPSVKRSVAKLCQDFVSAEQRAGAYYEMDGSDED